MLVVSNWAGHYFSVIEVRVRGKWVVIKTKKQKNKQTFSRCCILNVSVRSSCLLDNDYFFVCRLVPSVPFSLMEEVLLYVHRNLKAY